MKKIIIGAVLVMAVMQPVLGQTIFENNGKIGIGTTTPQYKLHVYANPTDGDTTAMRIENNSQQSAGTKVSLSFFPDNEHARFTVGRDGGNGNGNLNFLLRRSGTLTSTMYMDGSNGNVGIGTIAPTQKLEVVGNVKATSFIGDGSGLTGISMGTTPANGYYENYRPLAGRTHYSDYQDGAYLTLTASDWEMGDGWVKMRGIPSASGILYIGKSFILPKGYTGTISYSTNVQGGAYNIYLQSTKDYVTWTTLVTSTGGDNSGHSYTFSSLAAATGLRFVFDNSNGTAPNNLTVSNLVIPGLNQSNSVVPASSGRFFGTGLISMGNVGIGTTCPSQKLEVAGMIKANDLLLSGGSNLAGSSTDWADYVFEKSYQLMPLNKLEAYIQKNKHLPEIPSEKEVSAKGVSVAKMQVALLKKVEELTLYVIELKKENQTFKKEVLQLKESNQSLTKKVKQLGEGK